MAEFPYTPNPPNVGKFLDHIQETGTPNKVTVTHLKSVGFKSSNDGYLVGVLRALGFLDGSGKPTDAWKAYRDKSKARVILAGAIRQAYADLFSIYPDAYRKDDEALHNYFAGKTTLAKPTLERVVRTFKILCDRADFEGSPGPAAKHVKKNGLSGGTPPTSPVLPSVNINIQLHLPPTEDASVYDKLFAAMKKHLF